MNTGGRDGGQKNDTRINITSLLGSNDAGSNRPLDTPAEGQLFTSA